MDSEEYNEIMLKTSLAYQELLKQKEKTDAEIEALRVVLQNTLRAANRDTYDNPMSPVVVTFKMKRGSERMVKGAKEMLKNILSEEQYKAIYVKGEDKPALTVKRKDKMRDY